MGFNQHQRGVWVNEQCYMIHLLLGKHGTPGNGAFSLTGQPSACGTAREVGTFSHRLPADMVVDNPAHRALTEKTVEAAREDAQPEAGQRHHGDPARPRGRERQVPLGAGDEPVPVLAQRQPLDEGGARDGQLHRRGRLLSHRLGQGRGPGAAGRDDLREVGRLRQRRAAHADVAPAGRRPGRGAHRHLDDARVRQALQSGRGVGREERCPASRPRASPTAGSPT